MGERAARRGEDVPAQVVRAFSMSAAVPARFDGGTGRAESAGEMNRGRKSNKSAEAPVQKLPGIGSPEANRAGVADRSPAFEARGREARGTGEGESARQDGWMSENLAGRHEGVGHARSDRASAHEAALERLNRIEALLSQEAIQVRGGRAQSVQVVLRPDRETELIVQFTQQGGQLEAAVRCERGDLLGLNTHWNQLRHALAEHHVRLLPLNEPPPVPADYGLASGSRFQFSQDRPFHHHQTPQDPGGQERRMGRDGVLSPASEGTSPGGQSPARPERRNRWETWA